MAKVSNSIEKSAESQSRTLALPERHNLSVKYAFLFVIVASLGRLVTWTLVRPFSDRPRMESSYVTTAQDLLRLNFHALGERAPVYPLFVALFGVNLRAIWIAQSILGVAASLMIFDMAFRCTRRGLFAFLVGLTCGFIPELLVTESVVMTETLTSFLLVTSVWIVSRCDGAQESNVRYPLALGLVVALTGLTRPLMICLVPVYQCFLVRPWPLASMLRPTPLKRTLSFALPVIVLILAWCAFNYFNSGYFGPTTRAGQQLMDQVDPYVGLAPDRFAELRDIWLRSRQQAPPNRVNSTREDAYRLAASEMERRTGETGIQVSHQFASLAIYLETHHPLFCLRRVEQGWMQFWGEPNLLEVDWPQSGEMRLNEFAGQMSKFLTRQVKATFLLLALLSLPCALSRLKAFTRIEYLIFAMALWVSVFAGFTEFGDNRRFCVPLYMLIMYTLLTRGWLWITAFSLKTPQTVAG